jgi:hypothetical protein
LKTHIKQVSGSGVSALNVDNCFTTDFNVYQINLDLVGTSANFVVNLRLRAGGVSNDSSNYERQRLVANNTALTGFRSTGTSFSISSANANVAYGDAKIYYPADVQKTGLIVNSVDDSTDLKSLYYVGRTTITDSYDGFSLLISSGTVTGSVSVLGYKK